MSSPVYASGRQTTVQSSAAWHTELQRKLLELADMYKVPPSIVLQPPRSWHSSRPATDVVGIWGPQLRRQLSQSWPFIAACFCPELEEPGLLAGKMCRNGHWGYRRISTAHRRRDALAELVAEAVELERVRSARRDHRKRRRR